MSNDRQRHVDPQVIEEYFSEHLDGVLSIAGEPPARLVIAGSKSDLSIRVPATEAEPDLSGFTNIRLDFIEDEDVTWHQLTVKVDENLAEVYATLCGVLDRVQLSKSPFSVAVNVALDSLAEILARRRGLSDDQQLGLAGELLSFLALADIQGVEVALKAWTGPLGEEHDFALPPGDVEVKVTLSERRKHWISSVTQLVPIPSRDLYLLSIQLTAAGAGPGWSLPNLVDRARRLNETHAPKVDALLEGIGFHALDTDLYTSRWTLRSAPQFFLVDSNFPVISQESLAKSVPASNRVVEVRYRIDVTGLSAAHPLFSFNSLREEL